MLDRRHSATGPLRAVRVTRVAGHYEERLAAGLHLMTATLACPECDAPVALPAPRAATTHPVGCPYCGTAGVLRDFLSFDRPVRPARVEAWVRLPARGAAAPSGG